MTWQKLKDVLDVAGRILNVDLAKDKDGKSKGYASVQFSEPSEAIKAIGIHLLVYYELVGVSLVALYTALFHGQMLCDRPMKLRMASLLVLHTSFADNASGVFSLLLT